MPPKRLPRAKRAWVEDEGLDEEDEVEEVRIDGADGGCRCIDCALDVFCKIGRPAFACLAEIAPNADRALLDVSLDMLGDDGDVEREEMAVATPLTSLSRSSVGSLETNSFCSNCTTMYGRACTLRTLRPFADMSFTCIWPLEDDREEVVVVMMGVVVRAWCFVIGGGVGGILQVAKSELADLEGAGGLTAMFKESTRQ